MTKKIIAYFIINIMLLNFSSFSLQANAAEENLILAEKSIVISSASLSAVGPLPPGSLFRGTVTVVNSSNFRVEDISVKSETSNSNIIIQSFAEQKVGTLEAGQSYTVNFSYKVSDTSTVGETQIRFIAYVNNSQQDFSQTNVFVLGVLEMPEVEPYFEVLSSASPSIINSATPEFTIGIRFIVRDAGVNNVRISWTSSDDKVFEPRSPKTLSFGFMPAQSVEFVEFVISPTNEVAQGDYTFKITISGTNAVTYDYNIGIYVQKGAFEIGQGIKVISTLIPENAKTGDRFQIKSILQNTGAAVRNITVTLKIPKGIASNSLSILQIPILAGNEQREVVFELFVTKDAAENYNQFELIIEHDDLSFTYYTGLNIISDISREDIKIISTDIPESIKKGERFQIKATVVNEGGSEAKNISITLKSPAGIVNSSPNIVQIDSLARNGMREVTFDLLASNSAANDYNMFELITEYGDTKKSQYVGLNIIREEAKPSEFIITATLANNVKHNTDFKLLFTVKNNGGDAKNLVFSVPNPAGIINKTINNFSVLELKSGGSITSEITFYAKEDAAGKYCLFEITVSGKDADGKDITHAKQYTGISIDIIEEKTEFHPDLTVDYINIPRATGIERDFNVEIRLSNNGAEARNVIISLEAKNGLINKTSNVIKFDRIQQNASNTGSFTFMATESAIDGFNSINIKIEYSYRKADGTIASGDTINQYSGLLVSNPKRADDSDDTKKDMPVIIISRFDYGGEEVYGGKAFIFELDILNTHKSHLVKDLKVTLSQEKGIFTPKSGSNTFFIERLSPGASVGESIEMIVKTDALPDSYGLTITLTYKNEKGDSTTATEIINIPVQQETRFHIGEVPFINEVSLGDEAYVNIQFGNLGKSTIYNVNLKIESDSFYDPDGGYFAGNLEAGKSANKAFYLTPMMPGMAVGKIIFVYENALGDQFRDEIDISFMVAGDTGDFEFARPGQDGENMIIGFDEEGRPIFATDGELLDEDKGFFKWLFTDMGLLQWIIVIGTVLLVVAGIVVLAIFIKRGRDKITDDDDL